MNPGLRKGGRGPSEPSRDVIFLGLDAELTESDVSLHSSNLVEPEPPQFTGYLRAEHHALVDSVKIVRDKFSGVSKCFGFAQFASVEAAEEFIGVKWVHAFWTISPPRMLSRKAATQRS